MSQWFRRVDARPAAALRLVCFPHAGGSAAFFRTWTERLSPGIEMAAVQYPGRADRLDEAVVHDAETQVRRIVAALPQLADRPLALFGHSMGAILAYEVARSLEAAGTPPAHLFVSGCRAAHVPGERRVSELDDDKLVDVLTWMGGTDTTLLADPDLREMVLPYVRGDFRLVETYRHVPGPLLRTPVTSIVGEDDKVATIDAAARWAELTTGAFAQRVFPGDHFYLVPHRDKVIAEIEARLAGGAS
jgi:surfactin synthase thioesterase subunit